jgi:ADP-ribose pyrophosphatase YjhB (NUDIX family)
MSQIRPIAICVFLKNNKILVAEGYDPVKLETFYRPLGGGIEFGESSKETIRREIMEEINVEVDQESLRYLGAVENIFIFNGSPGHEIVLVYDGVLQESGLYEQAESKGEKRMAQRFVQSGKSWMSSLQEHPSCILRVWYRCFPQAFFRMPGDNEAIHDQFPGGL